MDPEAEAIATLLTTNAHVVADVLRRAQGEDPAAVVRAIAATRSLEALVDDTLRALVDRARRGGHTWAEIGEVLDVSRQAAFQRFGRSGRPSPTEREITIRDVEGPFQRALSVLDDFLGGRFEEMHSSFDNRMKERCSVELLSAVREKLDAGVGELRQLGKPAVSIRAGYTVIETPMMFDRDERTAIVTLDADERVAGFFVIPRSRDDLGHARR